MMWEYYLMKLIIDTRESELIKQVHKFVESNNFDVKVETSQMDLGDAVIQDNTGKDLVVFERKSLNDLCASIMDGRYKEQSFRLESHSIHNHNIYYVVEGVIESYVPRKHNRITRKAIYSTLVTLNYHKGFSVMRTTSLLETARFLVYTYQKIQKENKPGYYDKEKSDTETQDYSSVIKCSKKNQITTKNIHHIMLMQIPGVSALAAKTVMDKFDDMVELIASLQENPNALDGIEIENNGKKRALSKTAKANIKKYLLGEAENN